MYSVTMNDLPVHIIQEIFSFCNEVEGFALKLSGSLFNYNEIEHLQHPNPFQSYCLRHKICCICFKKSDDTSEISPIINVCNRCNSSNIVVYASRRNYNFYKNTIQMSSTFSTAPMYVYVVESPLSALVHKNCCDVETEQDDEGSVSVFFKKAIAHDFKQTLLCYAKKHHLYINPIYMKYIYNLDVIIDLFDIKSCQMLKDVVLDLNAFITDVETLLIMTYDKYCLYKLHKIMESRQQNDLSEFVTMLEKKLGDEIINSKHMLTVFFVNKHKYIENMKKLLDRFLKLHEGYFYRSLLGICYEKFNKCKVRFIRDDITIPMENVHDIIVKQVKIRKGFLDHFNVFLRYCFGDFLVQDVKLSQFNANTVSYLEYFMENYMYITSHGMPAYITAKNLTDRDKNCIHTMCLRVKCSYCSSLLFPDNSCSCTRLKMRS